MRLGGKAAAVYILMKMGANGRALRKTQYGSADAAITVFPYGPDSRIYTSNFPYRIWNVDKKSAFVRTRYLIHVPYFELLKYILIQLIN